MPNEVTVDLQQMLDDMRYPCAFCDKAFKDHSLKGLNDCFKEMGGMLRHASAYIGNVKNPALVEGK